LLFQPDTASLRRLFEQEFARHHTAQAARDLGLFLARHGDATGAREALREALRMEPQNLADSFELALVSPAGEAEPLLQRAAAGRDTVLAARSFAALGHLRDATGDKTGAAEAYRSAIALRESANTFEALANDVDPVEGISLLQRALAMNRRELGARHPQTATTEANLAGMLLNAGQTDASIRLIREAMAIFEERLGVEHPRVAAAATILAFGLRAKGDRAGAERYYRRALAIDGAAYGAAHPQTVSDARTLADFLQAP
jgi:tetratricopeptide (TPR) repeat protein